MKIQKFEDIIAWQKSQDLAVKIYAVFGHSKDFGFKNQILRAAISISNNIAEGFDRMSVPEFVKFLFYARGSCSEVKSMLLLAIKLNYITPENGNLLIEHSSEVSRIINGLIKSVKQ